MKPHPRPPIIRKTIKWGGAAVTVLLVVVWIGSGWVWWNLSCLNDSVCIRRGYIEVSIAQDRSIPALSPPAWWVTRVPSEVAGSLRWGFRKGLGSIVGTAPRRTVAQATYVLPLWAPAGVCLLATVAAWRLDTLARRRAKGGLNLCPKCGYDRTGILKDAKCPECGAVPASV